MIEIKNRIWGFEVEGGGGKAERQNFQNKYWLEVGVDGSSVIE